MNLQFLCYTNQHLNMTKNILYLAPALSLWLEAAARTRRRAASGLCPLHGAQTQGALWEVVEPKQALVTSQPGEVSTTQALAGQRVTAVIYRAIRVTATRLQGKARYIDSIEKLKTVDLYVDETSEMNTLLQQ